MTAIQIANNEAGSSVRAKLNALPSLQGSLLPKWQIAKGAVLAGARNGRILILGDSTTWGYGAAGATFGSNLKTGAWPTKLASLLSGGSWQSFFGNGDASAGKLYPGADTRIVPGSAWNVAGGSKIGLGQYPWLATAAGTFSFTPLTAFDTIEVYYITDPSFGSFTVNVDGGASLGTVNNAQSVAFRKVTYTVALGTHTINAVWAAGNAYLSGMVVYNSAAKEVTIINVAAAGAKIADVVRPASSALAYSPLNSLALMAPDLVILDMTINDTNALSDLPTYSADLQTFATAAKATGADLMLVTGNPNNPATKPSQIVQQQYIDAYKAVAAANSAPVVDIFALLGTFASANAYGLLIDDIHLGATGYGMVAGAVSRPLIEA